MEKLKDNLTRPSTYDIISDIESDMNSSMYHLEQCVISYLDRVEDARDFLYETLEDISKDRKSLSNQLTWLKEEISK
tara:strand:+ start:299 stop:529 length:231 start_codon:yes stop_codon:yes gene_type:complete